MLEGRSFVIFTDHLLFVGALSRVKDHKSDRQWRRQLSFITEFSTEIHHIGGPTNIVEDTLSCPAAVDRRSYLQAVQTLVGPGTPAAAHRPD
jgi:hypothetical protein